MTSPAARPPVACTIASNNYLALATVLAESYRRHHPGAEVWLGLADRRDPRVDYGRLPMRVVAAEELGIPAFPSFAFRYDQLELSTAIKPWLFAHLRDRVGHDRAIYFDPDILVTDRLVEVERALERSQAALTPHLTKPIDNEHRPSERQIRMMGVYNLGFLALRLDASTAGFLEWWQERLHRFCLVDPHHGLFVDQAWMDLAPAFLDRVEILRSPRLNLAYWNLAHRSLTRGQNGLLVDDEPLGFVHWSGVDLEDSSRLSRHQDRLSLERLPELAELLASYREAVVSAGHDRFRGLPYGFGTFHPGAWPIPKLLRRALLRLDPAGRRFDDPFDRERPDGFVAWLAEPLAFPLGVLTRAALTVWESDPAISGRFRDVAHDDLPDFVAWLTTEGAHQTGLPPETLAPLLEGEPEPAARVPYQQEPLRPFLRLTREEGSAPLETIELAAPGSWAGWLLEPFPATERERPWLRRLAMLLWERERPLQRAFPDPLGADADALAAWLAGPGAERLSLAAELARELAAALPSEVAALTVRPVGPWEVESRRESAADPHPIDRRKAPAPPPPTLGVQILAALRSEPEGEPIVRGALVALAEAGIPAALLDIDTDLLGNAVDGLFAPPEGNPWPILFTHLRLGLAPWRFGWLPAAATQGGFRIGYLDSELGDLPESSRRRLVQWDEIWVPSRFAFDAIAPGVPVPVRLVPPCWEPETTVPEPPPEPGRIDALFHADDPLERDDPWSVLTAARRLRELFPGLDWRLELRVVGLGDPSNPATAAAERLDALRSAASDLPVEIQLGPRPDGAPRGAVTLSLRRTGELSLEPLAAMAAGSVVVGPVHGALADLLDESTGFPVTTREVRLGRSHGPAPGTSTWIEAEVDAAASALAAALADPAGASARARAGHAHAAALYGRLAAATRWLVELDRLRDRLRRR